jgi:hypothetical protein
VWCTTINRALWGRSWTVCGEYILQHVCNCRNSSLRVTSKWRHCCVTSEQHARACSSYISPICVTQTFVAADTVDTEELNKFRLTWRLYYWLQLNPWNIMCKREVLYGIWDFEFELRFRSLFSGLWKFVQATLRHNTEDHNLKGSTLWDLRFWIWVTF